MLVRMDQGRLSAQALVRDCIERIKAREHEVHAWVYIDADLALKMARELDRRPRRGLLQGIPVGVKDVIDTFDQPTAYNSPIYAGHVPAGDAGCVAMLRAAGAVILGKTVTAEFASSHPGNTRNPHNLAHTPGGSSSGSAAAVADSMVPVALGTQTGGSVIRPASFCGIVGFKPSFGLITRTGVKQLSDSLDTVGVFARTVADAAIFTAALSGRNEFAEIRESARPRVGIFDMSTWPQRETSTDHALTEARQFLAANDCNIRQCALPAAFDAFTAAHHAIEFFELARALQHEYRAHADRLTAGLRDRIEDGLKIPGSTYEKALADVQSWRIAIDQLFVDVDVLLVPSAPGEAPAGLTTTGKATFNRLWTLLGLPAITLPWTRGPQGLPVGIQFVGGYRQDQNLLAHADSIFRSRERDQR